MSSSPVDIIIAGGGPVGLYLAGRLIQRGFNCRVLEKRMEPDRHSKSLGIHPVSLELFDEAGFAEQFLEEGLKIKRGIAFWNREKIGTIRFDDCPPPFRYILALPQWKTETILENRLWSLDERALIREAELLDFTIENDLVSVRFSKDGKQHSLTSSILVGCDGKNSFVRNHLSIPFDGSPYPDCYIMGDFSDNTSFGTDAAVYLNHDGLIESFPLPGGLRRWVVKTENYIEKPGSGQLADLIEQRIGHSLSGMKNVMMSSFGVQHFLARSFHSGNVLLAGDAAHVVSPIGGQGMNLGWLDAEACAETIGRAIKSPKDQPKLFQNYSGERRKVARQVAKRAEINMWLGRRETSGPVMKKAVTLMVKKPFSSLFARIFTMRGLGRWWI
jgi:2-polyprenyl-6-methoxyphenol hydroxylase-like FAD-dependent oxidoreductase